ncbi:MAG: hypothetical protein ACI9WU_000463 [Myxococcota bacterium]|jgi:hypothetical protein
MGAGEVLASRYRGYEYYVQFKSMRAWVKGVELEYRGARAKAAPAPARAKSLPVGYQPSALIRRGRRPDPVPEIREATHADRQVLEAFRLGIVPGAHVDDWTFGRDDELAHLHHWLDDEADGSMLIEGAYGSGKSHLLMSLKHRAAARNYVVSYSHLESGEESAAFPKRLYRQIARGLHAPGIGGLNHILMASVEKHGGNPMPDHPILGPVLELIAKGKIRSRDWAAISGEGPPTAATGYLPDFTTCANVYCNLLSGLAWLSKEILGFNGLALLVDEVETASACLYRFHWQRAQSFFRGLTMTANDEPDLLDEPVEKGRSTYVGTRTNLIYAGHRRIPYLYDVPCGLKVVLATTPGPIRGLYGEWRNEQTVIEIEPVRPRALRLLAERINVTYQSLHGVGFEPVTVTALCGKLMERFGSTATRIFIKAWLECLDFRRFHPDTRLKELLEGQRGW